MQLPQNIPTLGGLSPEPELSRRARLAQEGERALRAIDALPALARAAEAARKIDLSAALPLRWLRWPFLALLGAVVLWGALSTIAPRHVSQGLARLWRGDNGAPPVELSPIAGDLSITYLYPTYTGLPPRTEEGTAGDLHAPRGTEVRIAARADRDLAQAFAVVNGAAGKLDAQGQGRRQLSGSFT